MTIRGGLFNPSRRPPYQTTPLLISHVPLNSATPEQLWIRTLDRRLPFGKVLVAIANKHARQAWAMLARDVDYDPHACLQHPRHRQASAAEAA